MPSAYRVIAIVVAVNLILIVCFPPYDFVPASHNNAPAFEGFRFVLAEHVGRRLNGNFFTLELLVVAVNALIACLIARPENKDGGGRALKWQRAVLGLVGLNLFAALLFPPFANASSVSRAMLPSFDGFYFVFGDHSQRVMVTSILYLEACVILINGGLLWLLLRTRRVGLSTGELRELARQVQQRQRGR
jgi:hypothetical protein